MKSYVRLDLIRGIAAIMVLTGHLRTLMFADYNQQVDLPAIGKLFYIITGFGHQSVVIFFVLSGFFITKTIYSSLKKDRWSIPIYAIHRLARLWVVLIPGLLLALTLDQVGIQHFTHPAYHGGIALLPDVNPAQHTSPAIFLGNVFFVQTLLVPTFGSDAALWSLCNEFWYYCFLPLVIIPFFSKKKTMLITITCLLALICLNVILFQLLPGFLIFLMGAACFLVYERLHMLSSIIIRLLSLALFTGVLLATRVQYFSPSANDIILGIAFTFLLLSWLNLPEPPNKLFVRIAEFLSGFSYTVYVIHLPVALFCCGLLGLYFRSFSFSLLGVYFGLLIGILLFARLFYWLFERNTPKVRRFFEQKIKLKA